MTTDWEKAPDVKDQTVSYFIRGVKTLWKLVETERKNISLAISLLVAVELMSLSIPYLLKKLIDYLPVIREEGLTSHAVGIVAVMFTLRFGMLTLKRFVQEPIFLKAAIRLEGYWPIVAHKKLLALSIGYHEKENTGRKISKVNKGVERMVAMLGDFFWALLPSLFYLLLSIPIIMLMDWRLGLMFTLPLIPYVWINLKSYETFYPMWDEYEKRKEESVGLFCQSIINIRTVQAFVREKTEAGIHGATRGEMCRIDTEVSVKMQLYFFAMELVLGTCFLVTVVTGLYLTSAGTSTIGTVVYVLITGNASLQNLWNMIHVYTRMLRHLVAAERMQELLDEKVDVANEAAGIVPGNESSVIGFRNVTHIYPSKEAPVVHDFNLEIKEGEMLAFVGQTGAGKSTLVSLLARVQDPTMGAVTFGGIDVRQIDRDWYRKRFAVVPQDVEIYEGTMFYNITLANPDAPQDWVIKAVEAACLSEAVSDGRRFPRGLETKVGERGVRLSGGEKQRVGIARAYVALLSGSKILILDEATSSLDSQSEKIVQGFIDRLRRNNKVTIVAIAHRLSTIYSADRICVLENGKISDVGDHRRLMEKNGLYSRLVELQNMHAIRE